MISPRTIVLAVVLLISYVRGEAEYDASEVIDKNPEQLVELRGFGTETHYVRTHDGYYVHVVRIINPLLRSRKLKRPVVFNHGLLGSSTLWLINARDVTPLDSQCDTLNEQLLLTNNTSFINGPMMLANHGYDVWLMSMRGTDWSLRHDKFSHEDKEFWNYSLDDFALTDVPTVINFVRQETGAPKVGYVGHSQATFSVFGLLATRPKYADVIEPVVAVAPVAYMEHITSVARLIFLGTLDGTDKDMHGPFPKEAGEKRQLLKEVCGSITRPIEGKVCDLVLLLIGGIGKQFLKGYWSQVAFYTSLKVLRHFGQLVKHERFMMYDHGKERNKEKYGRSRPPSYPIARIRSASLCLFSTQSDSLSTPKDVAHFVSKLRVPLFSNTFIAKDFNHFDLITDKQAGELVFFPMLKIMEHFEQQSGSTCGQMSPLSLDANSTRFSDRPSSDVSTDRAKTSPHAGR